MSDLISRQGLLKLFKNLRDEHETDAISYVALYEVILQQPTIEAVPVVRCKDCKYFKLGFHNVLNADGLCENTGTLTDMNDFCSCGAKI